MEGGEAKINIDTANSNLRTKAEGMKIDVAGKTDADLVESIIEFRQNQSKGSRLAEYITGLRPDDPKMAARLIEDQKIVRGKYGLPDWFLRYDDVTEYKNCLDKIIKDEDIDVRSTAEYAVLFDKISVTAVSIGVENIAMDINNRDGEDEYSKCLQTLEHELIHAMQKKRYPGMSTELKEYEAYVSEKPVVVFEHHPDNIENGFFGYSLGSSIEGGYAHRNDLDGTSLKPKWKDPEYFLKNVDGISEEKIQEYKSKQAVNDTQKESLDNVRV